MSEDHSSSNSDEARVRKLSYERARRETISDKFRELGDLLVLAGFPKIASQADALAASIVFVREALDRGVSMKDSSASRASKRIRTSNEFPIAPPSQSIESERGLKDVSRKAAPVRSYADTASALPKRRAGPSPPYETPDAPTAYSSPSTNTSHDRTSSMGAQGARDIISSLPSEVPMTSPYQGIDTATSESDFSDAHPGKSNQSSKHIGHKRGRSGETIPSPKMEVHQLSISSDPVPHFTPGYYSSEYQEPYYNGPNYATLASNTSPALTSTLDFSSQNAWRPHNPNLSVSHSARPRSSQDFQLYPTEKMAVDQEASDDVVFFFSR